MPNWRSAAVLGSLLMLHNAQRFAPVPLFDELRLSLGTDYVGVGNLFGAYLLTYALFTIPAGMLADRYPTKRLILCGVILNLLAGVVFAVARGYPTALASRGLLGIAGALLYVPAVRHVVAAYPQKKRGTIMGWIEMGAGVGMAFSLILLPFLAARASLETTFLSVSVMAAAVLASTLAFLPPTPAPPYKKSQNTIKGLIRDRRFWSLLVFHFFGMLSAYAAMGWLPTFLRADFGYSAVQAGLVGTLMTAALILCSPLAGVLSDRLGKRTPVLFAGSIMAAAGFIVFITTHSAWAISAAALLMGMSMAFTIPMLMIMVGEMFGKEAPGFSVSMAGTVGQISSSLSGLVFGYALQVSNSFAVLWGLALVFTAARIPFLLGAKEKGAEKISGPHQ